MVGGYVEYRAGVALLKAADNAGVVWCVLTWRIHACDACKGKVESYWHVQTATCVLAGK